MINKFWSIRGSDSWCIERACRREEIFKLSLVDIDDMRDNVKITIPNTKTTILYLLAPEKHTRQYWTLLSPCVGVPSGGHGCRHVDLEETWWLEVILVSQRICGKQIRAEENSSWQCTEVPKIPFFLWSTLLTICLQHRNRRPQLQTLQEAHRIISVTARMVTNKYF